MPWDFNRTDTVAEIEGLFNIPEIVQATIPAVAAAAAYEIAVFKAPSLGSGVIVNRLSIFANVAIAAVATNFQTLQFRQWRAGALVGLFTGATTYVTTAALAVVTELALLTIANKASLQTGDVITLQSVTTGTGAALPAITAIIEWGPVAGFQP